MAPMELKLIPLPLLKIPSVIVILEALGLVSGELGFVAYSEPIEGSMFSEADKETKRAKGTSQI